jgi:RNA polymerase sigma-70 factor (sigma-E family)
VRPAREQEFEQFVRDHRASLLRTATTLTAGDRHLAEDLVQAALVNVYLAWPRVRTMNAPAYLRRAVVNGLIDHHRRSSTRHEVTADEVPDSEQSWPVATTLTPGRVQEALGRLPVGMRVAVVLRHVEGRSVEETADALGCSTGTAKSQTSRGLDKLRAILAEPAPTGVPSCPI